MQIGLGYTAKLWTYWIKIPVYYSQSSIPFDFSWYHWREKSSEIMCARSLNLLLMNALLLSLARLSGLRSLIPKDHLGDILLQSKSICSLPGWALVSACHILLGRTPLPLWLSYQTFPCWLIFKIFIGNQVILRDLITCISWNGGTIRMNNTTATWQTLRSKGKSHSPVFKANIRSSNSCDSSSATNELVLNPPEGWKTFPFCGLCLKAALAWLAGCKEALSQSAGTCRV